VRPKRSRRRTSNEANRLSRRSRRCGYLGQAAAGLAGTATFLGERHARITRRRGPAKAQVAIARSVLVIIWHLLDDPQARYADLGPGHYQNRIDKTRKARNHIRQLEALGYTVTLTQAA
jgi:transposase